jgi:hypothetical protein
MFFFFFNYIYIYNFFIYGVSPDISIFGGPVLYRPGFGNLETFPCFVQLSFELIKCVTFCFKEIDPTFFY